MNKKSLTGLKLELMISEPWDFGTAHGNGPFEVKVEKASDHALLLRLAKPLRFEGTEWEWLAVTPRYREADIESIRNGAKMQVNIVRVDEEKISFDLESFGWSSYRGRYSMLIGTLQKRKNR